MTPAEREIAGLEALIERQVIIIRELQAEIAELKRTKKVSRETAELIDEIRSGI